MPDIRNLSLNELKPWPRNARLHSRKQVKQLAQSIRRFGFTHPILIDEESRILAGHGRVRAAQELGLVEVPCLRITHLSPEEKRAYVLADNKLALNAKWDGKLLAEELTGLVAEDLMLDAGFSIVEIDGFIAGSPAKANGDGKERGMPYAPRRCRSGDIWRLGPHWLVCGEALKPDTVNMLIEGQAVQMLVARSVGASSRASAKEGGGWAGATLLSAENAGRHVVMSDSDLPRCDRIIQRWEDRTKMAASRFHPETWKNNPKVPA